ncbi:hypothetical protein EVAR_54245_1 [Eumeta japonica]|uniref:Uncharacterized protein n=1 Tax=Eumeta variegata TaxID=151549 RepID=A0A4C1YI10_EUMVA|nr:hypothetical protein EVAR_54245_1 [Eumeta japonica]
MTFTSGSRVAPREYCLCKNILLPPTSILSVDLGCHPYISDDWQPQAVTVQMVNLALEVTADLNLDSHIRGSVRTGSNSITIERQSHVMSWGHDPMIPPLDFPSPRSMALSERRPVAHLARRAEGGGRSRAEGARLGRA